MARLPVLSSLRILPTELAPTDGMVPLVTCSSLMRKASSISLLVSAATFTVIVASDWLAARVTVPPGSTLPAKSETAAPPSTCVTPHTATVALLTSPLRCTLKV